VQERPLVGAGAGAERAPDRELARAARDAVRDHRVDADDREQERERAEDADERREDTAPLLAEDVVESAYH